MLTLSRRVVGRYEQKASNDRASTQWRAKQDCSEAKHSFCEALGSSTAYTEHDTKDYW